MKTEGTRARKRRTKALRELSEKADASFTAWLCFTGGNVSSKHKERTINKAAARAANDRGRYAPGRNERFPVKVRGLAWLARSVD